MIKEAMEFLMAKSQPHFKELDERLYVDKELYPIRDPMPNAVDFNSLDGFCGFVSDNYGHEDYFVQICDESMVRLLSKHTCNFGQRECAARATTKILPDGFSFGKFMGAEEFNINVMTKFQETPGKDEVLKFTRKMSAGKVQETEDDGVTQHVTARQGVALTTEVKAPAIVELAPYRTFADIEKQPISSFLFRVRGGGEDFKPTAALFETDGGLWKLKAMKEIQAFIEKNLKNFIVLS